MKAAQINGYGDSKVVVINKNATKPTVSAGKIVVEVHAAGVNPFDWKIMEGMYQKMMPIQLPATLGGDFSGVVTEAGEGVSFKKGDAVYGSAIILSGGSGAFAEFASAGVDHVAKKPKNLNHLEAAALPLTGVSAWQALVDHIGLAKGNRILIHGAAGGIGTSAVQIAKHLGAHVAATASARDMDYVKGLGADEVIDYKSQSFDSLLSGYDAVYDTVGGDTYAKSFKVLKKGGIIVSMLEQPKPELTEKYGVKAIAQGTHINGERLSKVAGLVELGVLKVHVDKSFPLEKAGDALAYQKTGHPRGKVVLKIKD